MGADTQPATLICPACGSRYEGGAFCARDGTPLVKDPSQRHDLVGQVLAERYRVLRLVGEGGMGQVYEAQHVNINKRFAIKLLRPEIVSNGEAVARFRQEAWSASSIGHENIIGIDDFATLPSGAVYLAMEFLEGGSLAERMREEPPLTLGESLDLMMQVASGLGAAHAKGIIHRDMKPENIFLAARAGRADGAERAGTMVKILDFGIAKMSNGEEKSLTRTGSIFGTPHYMSPEQALGRPLDVRADIYSVGVIMYELFTGRVPFEAESFMGILTKHVTTAPRRPTELAPERNIPDEIEAVILRALAKEPETRYATLDELGQELWAAAERLAPEVLVGRRPFGAAASAARPVAPASGARAAAPSRATPSGATPALAAAAGADAAAGTTPASRRRSLYLSAAMLLVVGAVALVVVTREPPRHPATANSAATAASVSAGARPVGAATTGAASAGGPVGAASGTTAAGANGAATAGVAPANGPVGAAPATPAPSAPATEEVVVDSQPPGALIYVDGVEVGDTPEIMKVARGQTERIVIKLDGYVEREETLDPAHSHKLMVRLEKAKRPAHGHAGKPAPPPKAVPAKPVPGPGKTEPATRPAAPTPPPAAVTTPPPAPAKPKRPLDPYERVDDAPPKKGGSEVLTPY